MNAYQVFFFDNKHKNLVIFLFIFFSICVFLKIHGYSLPFWNLVIKEDHSQIPELIAGYPRAIRGDDWAIFLPMRLSQSLNVPPFDIENHLLGPGGTNMLITLPMPSWHFSTIFKPDVWGYFIGPDTGLAWNWAANTIGIFYTGFLLFSAISRHDFLISVLAASCLTLAPFFHYWAFNLAYIQIHFIIALLSFLHLVFWSKKTTPFLECALFIWASFAFVISMYPPLQITLGFLGVFIMTGFILSYRPLRWKPICINLFKYGTLSLTAIICLSWLFLEDIRESVEVIMKTEYPGIRSERTGGSLDALKLFSNYFLPFNSLSESKFSAEMVARFSNTSELSSSFLFFPVTLIALVFISFRLSNSDKQEIGLLFPFILALGTASFIIFGTIGFTPFTEKLLLLDKVPGYRVINAVILADLCLLTWWVSAFRAHPKMALPVKPKLIIAASFALFILVLGMLLANLNFPTSLSTILFLSLVFGAICFFVLGGRAIGLFFLLTCSILAVWDVNPVVSGGATNLRELPFSKKVVELDEKCDKQSTWLAFNTVALGNFFPLIGVKTINGFLYEPPLEFWSKLDPDEKLFNTYNRSANLIFEASDSAEKVSIKLKSKSSIIVEINPEHPAFNEIGVDYFVIYGPDPFENDASQSKAIIKIASWKKNTIYKMRNSKCG